MNKIVKHAVAFSILAMLFAPAFVLVAHAQDLGFNYVEDDLGYQGGAIGDPRSFVAQVVSYLMTFLGLIAVIVILIGGFKWMTASGNEDKVAEAKKTVIAGCIGLVIILAAYAIVTFVIDVTNSAVIEGDINNIGN